MASTKDLPLKIKSLTEERDNLLKESQAIKDSINRDNEVAI